MIIGDSLMNSDVTAIVAIVRMMKTTIDPVIDASGPSRNTSMPTMNSTPAICPARMMRPCDVDSGAG